MIKYTNKILHLLQKKIQGVFVTRVQILYLPLKYNYNVCLFIVVGLNSTIIKRQTGVLKKTKVNFTYSNYKETSILLVFQRQKEDLNVLTLHCVWISLWDFFSHTHPIPWKRIINDSNFKIFSMIQIEQITLLDVSKESKVIYDVICINDSRVSLILFYNLCYLSRSKNVPVMVNFKNLLNFDWFYLNYIWLKKHKVLLILIFLFTKFRYKSLFKK